MFTMALFFLSFTLISCFGWQTGCVPPKLCFGYVPIDTRVIKLTQASSPINPGRDLTGRAFMSMVGYPKEIWTTGNYFFWVSF